MILGVGQFLQTHFRDPFVEVPQLEQEKLENVCFSKIERIYNYSQAAWSHSFPIFQRVRILEKETSRRGNHLLSVDLFIFTFTGKGHIREVFVIPHSWKKLFDHGYQSTSDKALKLNKSQENMKY